MKPILTKAYHKSLKLLENQLFCSILIALYITLLVLASNFVYAQYLPKFLTTVPKLLIVAVFLYRTVIISWQKLNKPSKTIFIILLAILTVQSLICRDTTLIQLYVLSTGCFSLDFKKTLKIILIWESLLVLIIMALCLLGVIPDWAYGRSGSDVVRHSLGFQYSTYISIYTLSFTLYYLYIRSSKIRWFEYIGIIAVNIIAFFITNTRASLLWVIATIATFIILNHKSRISDIIKKTILIMSSFIIVLCASLSITVTITYSSKNPVMVKANSILSNRLHLGKNAINKYSLSMFGNDIEWTGWARIHEKNNNGQKFNVVDSFYVKTLLVNGIIVSILFFGILQYLLLQTKEQKNYYLITILILLAIQGIVDQQMIQLQWNAFSLLFFSFLLSEKRKPNTQTSSKVSLKELHKVQLKMVKKLAKFCDENNLTYYLCGGTLLGAIRHKGFIPWDDDIDILMPRPDFEQLQQMLKAKPLAKEYISFLPSDKKSPLPFIKIYNTDYEVHIKNEKVNGDKYIWIDVFPMDGCSSNQHKNKILYTKVIFWRKLLSLRLLRYDAVIPSAKTIPETIVKPIIKPILNILPIHFYTHKIDKLSQTYSYETSKYVGGVMWGYGPQERMAKRATLKKVKVEFEGEEFWTFSCYKQYLKNLYGNYMQLPPVEKRQIHLIAISKVDKTMQGQKNDTK